MVNRVYHLDRGFERLEDKLAGCGANRAHQRLNFERTLKQRIPLCGKNAPGLTGVSGGALRKLIAREMTARSSRHFERNQFELGRHR